MHMLVGFWVRNRKKTREKSRSDKDQMSPDGPNKEAEINTKKSKNPKKKHISRKTKIQRHTFWYSLVKCILLFLAMISIVLSLAFLWMSVTRKRDLLKSNEQQVHTQTSDMSIIASQSVSLRDTYSVDYEKLSEERTKNMKKYSYPYNLNGVDKRSQLSMKEFNDVYNGQWPVVITDVIPSWPAANWTRDFFLKNYGEDRITMKAVDGGLEKSVSLALPLHVFHKNSGTGSPNTWAYVEDELFIPMRPKLHADLGQTVYLEEDYFRLWQEEVRPWNAMLLWGTAYSRSSLHIDPYNWTGTNAVISGRKLWKLYRPVQDHFLYVKQNKLSEFPLNCRKYNSPVDAWDPDLAQYPLFKNAKAIELEQLPGELLIIPAGWFHQAFNSEETIAVSSQVMNSYNWRIVMEEVIKIGENIPRHKLPKDIDELPHTEQIKLVMSQLPQHILERGRAVTEDALNQIKNGYDTSRSMLNKYV